MNWPTPTKVYETFWRFAMERQAIFWKRHRGVAAPWTEDPILLKHRFTNCYRAADRVSQYLIKHVIYQGEQTPRAVFYRTMLFNLFKRVETWQLLERTCGASRLAAFNVAQIVSVLDKVHNGGGRIFTAAYMSPPIGHFPAARKYESYLLLLEHMLRDGAAERFFGARSLQEGYEVLRTYPSMGPFRAFQFTIDLNYSALTDWSESSFVVPGPGALDGIRKCFADFSGYDETAIINMCHSWQELEFKRLTTATAQWEPLPGRRLQLIDVQNLFCEISKYARLAHPDVKGANDCERIKQNYHPDPTPLEPLWFPPKWGINELVSPRTEVVNIRDNMPFDVYIGRAGHGYDGYFGNEFGGDGVPRTEAIAKYRQAFKARIRVDAQFREAVHALRGKRLGCFCKPLPCHGDVIVDYLDGKLDVS
jgi:hypothetical protein